MTLAPISTAGSAQTTVVSRRSVGGDSDLRVQQTAYGAASTYIWQPWFARLNGDLSLTYDRSDGADSRSSILGSGSGTLSILPLSKYPVTVSVAHSDSRVSGDFSGSNTTRDRAAISARAVLSQSLRTGLSASWDRADQDGSGVVESQSLALNVSKSFTRDRTILGLSSVDVSADLRHSSFDATTAAEDDRKRLIGTLNISARAEPVKDLNVQSRVSATHDDLSDDGESFTRQSLQAVSTAQWRPADQPFVVTGSLRGLHETIERDGDGDEPDTRNIILSGALGLRWPVTDRLSVNLGAQGGYEDTRHDAGGTTGEEDLDDGRRAFGNLSAGASYNSESRKISGFDWRWDSRGQVNGRFGTDDVFQLGNSAGLGHQFERKLDDFFFVPVRLALSQEGNVSLGVGAGSVSGADVSHAISLDYSGVSPAAATFARLSLRDNRAVLGDGREFQLFQARVGRRLSLDSDRRLQGNLSFQATRTAGDSGSDISMTAAGTVSYQQRNLFEIENLGLRSDLRLNMTDVERLFGEGDEDFRTDLVRNDWRNVLSYRIGRLTANLEGTVFQLDDGFGYLALLRLRRDFGGN